MFKKIIKISFVTSISYYTLYKATDYFPNSQFKYNLKGFLTSNLNLLRISNIILTSTFDYSLKVYPIKNPEENQQELRKFYSRLAKRIFSICSNSRGILVKFAQYISNLERIVPKEITEILKELQDQCPGYDLETMKLVLDRELGKNWRQELIKIEEKPIGSASLAQVHKGELKTGEEVAIKVQYPELKVQYKMDIGYLTALSKVGTFFFNLMNNEKYDFELILNKFKNSLKEEIDFEIEVNNSEISQKLFEGNDLIKIPKNYKNLSTKRIIVMEYVEGINIDENEKLKAAGFDLLESSRTLIKIFTTMIFANGHVHCDAHAGNIFVRKNPKNPKKTQIILLDHGFYRTYPQEFINNIKELWLALINQDHKQLQIVSKKLGLEKHYEYLPLVFLFKTKNSKKIGEKIQREDLKNMSSQQIISFHRIHKFIQDFPDDFLLAMRTINLLAIRNASLGGSTRDRLLLMTEVIYDFHYKNKMQRLLYWFTFRLKLFIFENLFFIYKKIFFIDIKIVQIIQQMTLIQENFFSVDLKYKFDEIDKVSCKIFSDVLKEHKFQEFQPNCTIENKQKLSVDISILQNEDLLFLKNNMLNAQFIYTLKNGEEKIYKQLFFIDLEKNKIKFILLIQLTKIKFLLIFLLQRFKQKLLKDFRLIHSRNMS